MIRKWGRALQKNGGQAYTLDKMLGFLLIHRFIVIIPCLLVCKICRLARRFSGGLNPFLLTRADVNNQLVMPHPIRYMMPRSLGGMARLGFTLAYGFVATDYCLILTRKKAKKGKADLSHLAMAGPSFIRLLKGVCTLCTGYILPSVLPSLIEMSRDYMV